MFCDCRDDVAVCYRKYLNGIGPVWEESLRKNAGIKSVRTQIAHKIISKSSFAARKSASVFLCSLQVVPGCSSDVDISCGL